MYKISVYNMGYCNISLRVLNELEGELDYLLNRIKKVIKKDAKTIEGNKILFVNYNVISKDFELDNEVIIVATNDVFKGISIIEF